MVWQMLLSDGRRARWSRGSRQTKGVGKRKVQNERRSRSRRRHAAAEEDVGRVGVVVGVPPEVWQDASEHRPEAALHNPRHWHLRPPCCRRATDTAAVCREVVFFETEARGGLLNPGRDLAARNKAVTPARKSITV